jgi:hypothetical protein
MVRCVAHFWVWCCWGFVLWFRFGRSAKCEVILGGIEVEVDADVVEVMARRCCVKMMRKGKEGVVVWK